MHTIRQMKKFTSKVDNHLDRFHHTQQSPLLTRGADGRLSRHLPSSLIPTCSSKNRIIRILFHFIFICLVLIVAVRGVVLLFFFARLLKPEAYIRDLLI